MSIVHDLSYPHIVVDVLSVHSPPDDVSSRYVVVLVPVHVVCAVCLDNTLRHTVSSKWDYSIRRNSPLASGDEFLSGVSLWHVVYMPFVYRQRISLRTSKLSLQTWLELSTASQDCRSARWTITNSCLNCQQKPPRRTPRYLDSGNLSDAIDANNRSILGYGSEFRPVEVIAKIYKNHPLWDRTKNILLRGSDWPLEPITEEQR